MEYPGSSTTSKVEIKTIVILMAITFMFSMCVITLQGCAMSVVDGSRRLDWEVFMPIQQWEVDQVEDDESWMK